MRRAIAASLAVVALLLTGVSTAEMASGPVLGVGDPAPEFEMQGSDGRLYTLADLLAEPGRDAVALAWFPKAFTPG